MDGKWIAYDNTCDHNGGTLCVDKGTTTATCPIHKWTLLLNDAKYINGCTKPFYEATVDSEHLVIKVERKTFPKIDTADLSDCELHFNFNAHASVSISTNGINIITDPWLIGSCFATGWWHAFPPSDEAIDRLVNSDLIYISHNHPDHLHLPTLEQFVAKDKPILIPNFESGSVEKILRRNGYNQLISADFLQEILVEKNGEQVKLIIVKSGDERDDSSLFIYTKTDSIFFGVDTNMPNQWILPKVNMLFTAFSGGASGFPIRIDNFDENEKIKIVDRNRKTVLSHHVAKLVKATSPSFVVPYAGYFTEAFRDMDVHALNKKNSADDLIQFVERRFPNTKGINPLNNPSFKLFKNNLAIVPNKETPAYYLDHNYIKEDIYEFSKNLPVLSINFLERLGKKFIESNFHDHLTLVIIPCDDEFNASSNLCLCIDYSDLSRNYVIADYAKEIPEHIASRLKLKTKNNIEILRVREDSLRAVVFKGYPLEDLSIGFQTKMYRDPNQYNFKFWDYFTNHEVLIIDSIFASKT
jgi:CMP-N-acetylneuraminate monooxygenase